MRADLLLSLVVCTRNRAASLRAMLESACALDVPVGTAWELLVVDNGSEDETAETASSFAGRLPLRLVSEPAVGHCPARNRGVAEAKGRWICWADDDVLLDPGWLSAWLGAFGRYPEASVLGGHILPRPIEPSPDWFRRHLREWPIANLVAFRDLHGQLSLEGGRIPWGANFAVRADVQKSYAFNVELGYSPLHRRTGEETDVVYRILRDGGRGWWVPGSIVRHVISSERQTLDYLSFYYDQAGRTAAWLHDRFPGDNANEALGTPLLLRLGDPALRLTAGAFGLVARAALFAGPNLAALRFRARASYCRGILAHRGEARVSPPLPETGTLRMKKAA
ncbi:MAG TPA: glycosyltransferase [Allosphingosinicella sp.]|nr:glycosyltransferase [Allosphingosinicella sp.]